MTPTLEELRSKARAANTSDYYNGLSPNDPEHGFHSAANPETILKLLDALDVMEKGLHESSRDLLRPECRYCGYHVVRGHDKECFINGVLARAKEILK